MKTTKHLIKKHRLFSEEFKRGLVKEFESGSLSVQQLSKLYQVSTTSIYKWIYNFSTFNQKGSRIVEMKDSSTAKLKEMEQRIKDLERAVGQKQIKIDYLEKMIDIAKTDLDIDIKKNYNTSQSGGSGRIDNK
jgi:transposase